jgi:multiple sugar transport system permease protein/cellobiose transport system permease protein
MRTSLPTEILESGRIDGCSEIGIFFRLVIPYVKPALVSVGVLVFLWSWNNYILPLIIINKPDMYTIPLVIVSLTEEYMMDYGARLMGLTIGTIPVLLLFVFQSKALQQGLTAGAIKG